MANRNDDFDDSIKLDDDFVIESADEDSEEDMELEEEASEEDMELEEDGEESAGADGEDYEEEMILEEEESAEDMESEGGKKFHFSLAGKIGLGILAAIILFSVWLLATDSGRRFGLSFVAKYIHNEMDTGEDIPDEQGNIVINEIVDPDGGIEGKIETTEKGDIVVTDHDGNAIEMTKAPRSADNIKTYLIFGIEEIDGASNTDAIMLVSYNTDDGSISLASIMRDTYVDIPGSNPNKINSVYAKGAHGAETAGEARKNGAALLMRVIEETFDVDIIGCASVNFKNFEKIIDAMGGLEIDLGEKEAAYLNRTNYISDPANRNVRSGLHTLNGNQVLGYARVRKEATKGGATNDYGRTLRHRRIINAVISKCKSKSLGELVNLMNTCLPYVYTSLSEDQITDALAMIVNSGIGEIETMRIPYDELFYDSGREGINNGSRTITYALVIKDHLDENIAALHRMIFGDEAAEETDGATQ